MVAIGTNNVLANTDIPDFQPNTFYRKGDIVNGNWMSSNLTFTWICKIDHTSANTTLINEDMHVNDGDPNNWEISPSNGDTLFVVGNGNNVNNSNAMKLDLIGNQYLGGTVYVNCESDSTDGTEVATKDDVDAVDFSDRLTKASTDSLSHRQTHRWHQPNKFYGCCY